MIPLSAVSFNQRVAWLIANPNEEMLVGASLAEVELKKGRGRLAVMRDLRDQLDFKPTIAVATVRIAETKIACG